MAVTVVIKPIETHDELMGKAYVHWKAWHETYPGMADADYLDRMTLEVCEQKAAKWGGDGLLIAAENGRVIGFVGYGDRGGEAPNVGEIFALYVLSDWYGKGVGRALMDAALEKLSTYPSVCLWVLKENRRAIRFYEKCGFAPDGQEHYSEAVKAMGIRMVRKTGKR